MVFTYIAHVNLCTAHANLCSSSTETDVAVVINNLSVKFICSFVGF